MSESDDIIRHIATEYATIVTRIYNEMLTVVATIGKVRPPIGNVRPPTIEVVVDWCNDADPYRHAFPDVTHFGRLLFTYDRIYVINNPIDFADPELESKTLSALHERIISRFFNKISSMEKSNALGRTRVLSDSIEVCFYAITFLDLRYLAHMYKTAYVGWERIPDYTILGSESDNSRRLYKRELIENEMHNPSWRKRY